MWSKFREKLFAYNPKARLSVMVRATHCPSEELELLTDWNWFQHQCNVARLTGKIEAALYLEESIKNHPRDRALLAAQYVTKGAEDGISHLNDTFQGGGLRW